MVRVASSTPPPDGDPAAAGAAGAAQAARRDASICQLSCGGGYWSHEGDVPGYNTIGAVSSDRRTAVVLSVNSNADAALADRCPATSGRGAQNPQMPGPAKHIKRGSAGPARVETVWQGIRWRDTR